MRLIVLGMMGRCPFAGQSWLSLNWLSGLRDLGHEVWYVEDDLVWPYDPIRHTLTEDPSYAVQHIRSCCERIGLNGRWAYRFPERPEKCWGLSAGGLGELFRSADVLFDFGTLELRDEHMAVPVRVYIESDPVMSQLRIAGGDHGARAALERHTHLFTYGENYGAPDCGVPLCGIAYQTTRQAVSLPEWPFCFDPAARNFTTIGNYRQEGNDISYNGETYRWSKHYEWEKFVDLPCRTAQKFELAVYADHPADRELLASHGWHVSSPYEMSMDVFGAYRDFIRQSRAEFTVAKDQNVRLRSGWFSERDACYLASGKPVIAQDTGFSNILPTGEGLFGFNTTEEAVAAIDAINGDYRRHCRAARSIAEEYFAAPKVASRLLAGIGA